VADIVNEIADDFKQEKVQKMAVPEQGRLIGTITRSTVPIAAQ
jgi:hypothetical protein